MAGGDHSALADRIFGSATGPHVYHYKHGWIPLGHVAESTHSATDASKLNASLTPAETDAVRNYQWGFVGRQSMSGVLNSTFRKGKKPTAKLTQTAQGIDSAIAKSRVDSDTTVHRVVHGGTFWQSLKPGDEFSDAGYVSTAADPELLKKLMGNPDVQFEIHVPAGSQALTPGKGFAGIDDYLYQSEVLLPRGSKFKVEQVESGGYPWRISLTLLPPN